MKRQMASECHQMHEFLGSPSTYGYPIVMQRNNYWLLGCVLFLNGACGARTGIDDFGDAGYFYEVGGAYSNGGATVWVAGGMFGAGGAWAAGGWNPYATGGTYGVGGATYNCPAGYFGCPCSGGYYCNSPYSCSYGICSYSEAAGGSISYGGASSCVLGTFIALVLTATTAIPRTLAFTAPAFTIPRGLGAHPVLVVQPAVTPALLIALVLTATIAIPRTRVALMDFVITMELLGVHPVTAARFPVAALHTRRAEAYPVFGGSPSVGGASVATTGGVSPIVNCTESLAACVNDTTGCALVLSCFLSSVGQCSGDLSCYVLACQNTITPTSAPLALQILQNCSTLIGL